MVRVTLLRGLGLILSGMTCLVPIAHSQSHSVGAFFEKDYAGSPKLRGDSLPEQHAYTPAAAPKAVVQAPQQPSAGPPPQQSGPPSGQEKQFRMRVTLYVSSKDKRHLEEAMRTAFKVAAKNPNVVMAEVYHIGDYRNVSETTKQEAAARKIFMMAIQQPPKNLNIVSSPAWVLRDRTGIHIVEGIQEIDKCIDLTGEYKEPKGSMFQEPPTPTIGVKSF
jgi:hypothetical protein